MSQLLNCPIDFFQEDVFFHVEIFVHLRFLKSGTRKKPMASDAALLKCFFEHRKMSNQWNERTSFSVHVYNIFHSLIILSCNMSVNICMHVLVCNCSPHIVMLLALIIPVVSLLFRLRVIVIINEFITCGHFCRPNRLFAVVNVVIKQACFFK